MTSLLKKFKSNQDGNFGVLSAIGGAALLSASALAIESNILFSSHAGLQSALDAATLAAAGVDAASQDVVARETFDLAIGSTSVEFAADGVNITREGEFIVGTAQGTVNGVLGGVLMPLTTNLSARSVVGFLREEGSTDGTVEEAGTRACIIALHDGDSALRMNSNSNIEAPDCEIHIHSRSNNPVSYDSFANVSKICLAGANFSQNNNFENNNSDLPRVPRETNCDVVQDPYAGTLPDVNLSSVACNDSNLLNDQDLSLTPGRYCNGFNARGDIHFAPGTYYIEGGWNIDRGRWTGDDVTFVFKNNGNFQFNGSFGGLDMSAPTSGDYANLFMVDENGRNRFQLNSGNDLQITGGIYMPKREFAFNANSTVTGNEMHFVVSRMSIDSQASLRIKSSNTAPPVPSEVYAQVPSEGGAGGEGVGDVAGNGSDPEQVASSEGIPGMRYPSRKSVWLRRSIKKPKKSVKRRALKRWAWMKMPIYLKWKSPNGISRKSVPVLSLRKNHLRRACVSLMKILMWWKKK